MIDVRRPLSCRRLRRVPLEIIENLASLHRHLLVMRQGGRRCVWMMRTSMSHVTIWPFFRVLSATAMRRIHGWPTRVRGILWLSRMLTGPYIRRLMRASATRLDVSRARSHAGASFVDGFARGPMRGAGMASRLSGRQLGFLFLDGFQAIRLLFPQHFLAQLLLFLQLLLILKLFGSHRFRGRLGPRRRR